MPSVVKGVFLTILFAERFIIEFVKNVQEPWENDLIAACGMNMGQLLSVPFIILGVVMIVYAMRRPPMQIDFPNRFADAAETASKKRK